MTVEWRLSNRAERAPRIVADRHYSRQSIGAPQFVPPGRCLVLYAGTESTPAYWVTSWPFAEFTKHVWAGAWVCSAFRNEGVGLSSALIRDAVAATVWRYGAPPPLGMVTFVDESKVRHKRDPGRCFLRAGFVAASPTHTKGRLLALQLHADAMPQPIPPSDAQLRLFG